MLPFGRVKHLFSFLLGAFLLQFVLGVQWIHHLISTLACYLCFALLPPSINKYLVPSIAIGYCIVGHVHRQYINYMGWDLDFTGAQMVLTIKVRACESDDAQRIVRRLRGALRWERNEAMKRQ